jgi:hypothetical protein
MIARNAIPLVFALLSVLAVCGCGDDSPTGEATAGMPGEMQRLLPKEVGLLAQSVQAAGGRTLLRPESGMVLVMFEGGSFGDAELASLQHLEFGTSFSAPNAQLTDEGLAQLASVGQRIATLELTGNPITDAGLAHLKQMKSLKFVVLDQTQVTPTGVEELRSALPGVNVGFSP